MEILIFGLFLLLLLLSVSSLIVHLRKLSSEYKTYTKFKLDSKRKTENYKYSDVEKLVNELLKSKSHSKLDVVVSDGIREMLIEVKHSNYKDNYSHQLELFRKYLLFSNSLHRRILNEDAVIKDSSLKNDMLSLLDLEKQLKIRP